MTEKPSESFSQILVPASGQLPSSTRVWFFPLGNWIAQDALRLSGFRRRRIARRNDYRDNFASKAYSQHKPVSCRTHSWRKLHAVICADVIECVGWMLRDVASTNHWHI
jgi:hypothetical protein